MLGWIHYGSTNEKHKITYREQAFAPCDRGDELYQMRKLPGPEKTPHRLLRLRFLSREKGFGSYQESRKEAEKSESKKGGRG